MAGIESSPKGVRLALDTPLAPGAVAIIRLGGNVEPMLRGIAGTMSAWPIGCMRLVNLGGIDDGLVARIAPACALVMPHGGVRIVERVRDWLVAFEGVSVEATSAHPRDAFPEASDAVEALMLNILSRVASSLAVDLLLDQPKRWRSARSLGVFDLERSRRLSRLLHPPLVVVAGAPNAGKSTLSNRLLGRPMSIASEFAGTTRDYVAARIDLRGLVVDWVDTPGLRSDESEIETRAIDLARKVIARADCLISLFAPDVPAASLPRIPDLRVLNKCDLATESQATGVELAISALNGTGIEALVARVRDLLVPPADLAHPGPWLFDERLPDALHDTPARECHSPSTE